MKSQKGGKLSRFIKTGFGLCSLAMICCLLWGSAFAGVKTGYRLFDIKPSDWQSQMVFAGIRFFIAGIMALITGSAAERKLLLPAKSSLPKICIICLFQTVLQYFFYYIGLAHTTGVKAAVIVAANVFTAMLIASLIFRTEKLTARKLAGCAIGFSGIILINLNGLGGQRPDLFGDGFIFLCAVSSGVSSALMKKLSRDEDPVLLSGWQFVLGGALMWGFGAVCGGSLGRLTLSSGAVLLYLAFVSAAAYSIWSLLLKYHPVSRVSVFGLMNPVCGVIISAAVLGEGEDFGITGICALLLVCAGIYAVNSAKDGVDRHKGNDVGKV